MSLTPLDIYLWQLADNFCAGFMFLTMASGIALVLLYTLGHLIIDDSPDLSSHIYRMRETCLRLFSIAAAAAILIPSSDTIAMMYVIPEIANSDIIQKDAPELFKAAVEAAKEALKP